MRNAEVLKRHAAVAAELVAKGFRKPLDREALASGGFEPMRAPEGSGPPYQPDAMRRAIDARRAANTKDNV
jgi:hypothetical protein